MRIKHAPIVSKSISRLAGITESTTRARVLSTQQQQHSIPLLQLAKTVFNFPTPLAFTAVLLCCLLADERAVDNSLESRPTLDSTQNGGTQRVKFSIRARMSTRHASGQNSCCPTPERCADVGCRSNACLSRSPYIAQRPTRA